MSVDTPRSGIPDTAAEFHACISALRARLRAPGAAVLPVDHGDLAAPRDRGRALSNRFLEAAIAAGATPTSASPASAAATLDALLRQHQPGLAYVEPAAAALWREHTGDDLVARFAASGARTIADFADPAEADADLAITRADAAVAETGSLICVAGPARPRKGSLTPRVHVALLREADIAADLFDAIAWLEQKVPQLPANLTLITGPSKTADIEGVLVTGVHGPGAVIVLMLTDG